MKTHTATTLLHIMVIALLPGFLTHGFASKLSNNLFPHTSISYAPEISSDLPTQVGPENPAELEDFIDGVIAEHLETYHLAGATVAVVKEGEVLLAKGYGFADVEAGIPVDAETTLFRIGSVTKLFTFTAVMQLVERGAIDLDADINQYLDFEIPATFPQPITLKHLMTHMAGFEEMGFGLFAASAETKISNEQWLKNHLPARVRPPGETSAYSNYGAALAGYIVERQSGTLYEEYINQNILTPLGMKTSSAMQPLPDKLAAGMSCGYRYAEGIFAPVDFELVNAAPAGSISASAMDMARFMIAHLDGGAIGDGHILDESTIQMMHRRIWTADKRMNGWALGFYEMSQNGYRVIGHGGDTRLFHSLLALLPEEKVGVFVSYNTLSNSMAPQKLLEAFMDHYYPGTNGDFPVPPTGTKERAFQVAGSYRLNRSVYTRAGGIDSLAQPIFIMASKDGSLTIPTPIGMKHFIEVAPYFYQEIGGNDKAVFWLDSQGQVTHTFLNSFPMMAAERQPWYQATVFHLGLIVVCLLMAISALLAAIAGLITSRRHPERPAQPKLARCARWVLGGAALSCLFFVAFYVYSLGTLVRLQGQRGLLDMLSWIALAITILSNGSLILSFAAWRWKFWGVVGRIHYSLTTMSTIIFTLLLIYYRQIGWQW